MAKSDPSPVVRLFPGIPHCSDCRLRPSGRGIAEGLLSHDDGADANLPLMDWYGVEPLAPANPARAMQLAVSTPISLVHARFIARRVVDDAVARREKGDPERVRRGTTQAPAKGVQIGSFAGGPRGTARQEEHENAGRLACDLCAPDSKRRPRRARACDCSCTRFWRPALPFIDSLRKTAIASKSLAAERQFALQALIDKHVEDLAPVLLDLLRDEAVRRIALRGLAAFPNNATPGRILVVYRHLTADEKQGMRSATLASRKEYALELLNAVDKKTIPRADVSAFIARQLNSLGDKQVTDRLRQVWGEVRQSAPQKLEQLARYKTLLNEGPLSEKRRSEQRQIALQQIVPAVSQVIRGRQRDVGPDLTEPTGRTSTISCPT